MIFLRTFVFKTKRRRRNTDQSIPLGPAYPIKSTRNSQIINLQLERPLGEPCGLVVGISPTAALLGRTIQPEGDGQSPEKLVLILGFISFLEDKDTNLAPLRSLEIDLEEPVLVGHGELLVAKHPDLGTFDRVPLLVHDSPSESDESFGLARVDVLCEGMAGPQKGNQDERDDFDELHDFALLGQR